MLTHAALLNCVMAGLDPATHVFVYTGKVVGPRPEPVLGRAKPDPWAEDDTFGDNESVATTVGITCHGRFETDHDGEMGPSSVIRSGSCW